MTKENKINFFKKYYKFWLIFIIAYFVLSGVLLVGYFVVEKFSNKYEVEDGQYLLIYECDLSGIGTTYKAEYIFTNYTNYVEQFKFAKKLNCNILYY